MKIAISGASGPIGHALQVSLLADGHQVLTLVRREASAPTEVRWDPMGGDVDTAALAGVDAVVHLAGQPAAVRRWTEGFKREFRDSRVVGTTTIARALATMQAPPAVLVSQSAIGYYGDTGSAAVDETAPSGNDFFAEVTRSWEAAATPAADAGIRVVHPRTGLVVTRTGGAFGPLRALTAAGLGGRMGSGRQYWSFISLADEVRALRFLIDTPLHGAANLTAPHPATNGEITDILGRLLHRPTLLPVPAFALRATVGDFAVQIVGSARVVPHVLTEAGFTFLHPTADAAMQTIA